jgi:hypothetical protein
MDRPVKAIEVYRGTGIAVIYQSAEGGDRGFISHRDLREINPAPAQVTAGLDGRRGHNADITT